jgi:hypothetical protein
LAWCSCCSRISITAREEQKLVHRLVDDLSYLSANLFDAL